LILRVLNHVAQYTPLANPPESIESGNYGDPPRATWWLKQSFIYFMGQLGMKTCVFFLIQLLPFIVRVGDWALRWTEGNTAVQIIFVMLLFPVIMNAIQYYIIDTFIKKPILSEHQPIPGGGEDDDMDDGGHQEAALLAGLSDDDSKDSDIDVDEDQANHLESKTRMSEPLIRSDDDELPPASQSASGSSAYDEDSRHLSTKLTPQGV
jgi:hypothetical protein